MRTLHIDTGIEMRGGQRQVLLLLDALAVRNEPFQVLARRDGALAEAMRSRGWPVRNSSLINIFRYSAGVEVVHAHDARAHTLAAVASQRSIVVSRRVVFPVRRSLFSKWKYRQAHAYLSVSQAVAKELESAGVPSSKINIVHDAVRPSSLLWKWRPGAPIVTLASDDPAKGTQLVRAASGLLPGIPITFSYDLAKDLQTASAFLYITQSEGLGSAALLAMSMGVPVIASEVGGLAEVFEDKTSGLYVANEPSAIAAAMERITTDQSLAERLSCNGRTRVQQDFTVESLVNRTLLAYRSVL